MVAQATATGGPVAIIRVSGNDLEFLNSLLKHELPTPGTFRYQPVYDKGGGNSSAIYDAKND